MEAITGRTGLHGVARVRVPFGAMGAVWWATFDNDYHGGVCYTGRMLGIVLVTHGNLALELLAAMQHVVGPQAQVGTVCIFPEDDMTTRRDDIQAAVAAADTGQGVILCTDLFGGTPSNLCISLLETHKNIEVLAGVNLPMLIKLASARKSEPLHTAALQACEAGRKYINVASELLNGA
jgi:PTS system mannose-specific IIA component